MGKPWKSRRPFEQTIATITCMDRKAAPRLCKVVSDLVERKERIDVSNGLGTRGCASRDELIEADEAYLVEQEDDQAAPRSSARGGDDSQLSANFRVAEFYCKDGTPAPNAAVPALRRLCRGVLQPLRDTFGRGRVISGHRTRSYNDRLRARSPNVAKNSQQSYDDGPDSVAADVRFEGGTPQEWHAAPEHLLGDSGGLGLYRNFVHCDNRSRKARW